MMNECQSAIAEAVAAFGKVDILLCCTSQGMVASSIIAVSNIFAALIGTVEELAASQQTLNLVREQFEVNYFGPLNIIRAVLPHMRGQRSGHIMILSGISESR